jgi:hypothetical protein
MEKQNIKARKTVVDGLASWKYQILFAVWASVTAVAFSRIRRQPYSQSIKIEQYESVFKGTSLSGAVTGIALSGKPRNSDRRMFK